MTTADQPRAAPLAEERVIRPQKQMNLMRQQRIWGWVFLSPWVIGFILFTAAPIVFSFILTFTNFTLSRPNETSFVGLRNWQYLFSDPLAVTSMLVTIKYALIAVPVGLVVPLSMAMLLNSKKLWGKRFFRTLFYLPYMVPSVSAIFIWMSFLNGQSGWLNRILALFGITDAPNWLQDKNTILFGFLMIGLWGAGNAMLTMLATIQGVPTELYEASEVDGAGYWTRFRKITLPMISPVIFYNLVLSVIGLMQFFDLPWIATEGTGRPDLSSYFFNMHLYKTAFLYQDMGYGATLAWLVFFVALVLTIFLFATARRWVYYASGD
jgi:multiple sugar transport system permease protein